MQIFLKFLGWLILYSLLYFLSLDITGDPPGTEETAFHKIFNMGFLLIISIPLWWFSWKKFEAAFAPREPVADNGVTTFRFALRNPALMYYLMVLKLFLLAMGANGIITLSHHTGAARIFYIVNFIVLYIYAVPFFVIKFGKLKKALSARVTIDNAQISLVRNGTPAMRIPYEAVQMVLMQKAPPALCVAGPDGALCLSSKEAKASPFYVPGIEQIADRLQEKASPQIQQVDSLKAAMKERAKMQPACVQC